MLFGVGGFLCVACLLTGPDKVDTEKVNEYYEDDDGGDDGNEDEEDCHYYCYSHIIMLTVIIVMCCVCVLFIICLLPFIVDNHIDIIISGITYYDCYYH